MFLNIKLIDVAKEEQLLGYYIGMDALTNIQDIVNTLYPNVNLSIAQFPNERALMLSANYLKFFVSVYGSPSWNHSNDEYTNVLCM